MSVLDLLFPKGLYCICCGKVIDETRPYRLCNDCMDGIKWAGGRTCAKCGKVLSVVNPGEICFNCREHEHIFDKGSTCAEYGTHERALVFHLKYDGQTDIADTIGEIMYDRMTAEFGEEELRAKYDMVLPVPIHNSKRYLRGFNQAGLIAKAFAARCGLHYDEDILVRTKETHIMRSLGPEERKNNIRGAFGVRPWRKKDIAGTSILVVDDIYTTGATIDEIATILKYPHHEDRADMAGASRVDFLSFASGADVVKSN